jgi:hypothetical protein
MSPQVIQKEITKKTNPFLNFKNIETITFEKLEMSNNKYKFDRFLHLIQYHYFKAKDNYYYPKKQNIYPYFIGHDKPCLFSFYYNAEPLIHENTGQIITDEKMIGVITSRPLIVSLHNKKINVYYVEYLCVEKEHRKKQIAPQLIQTEEYQQRHVSKNEIQVSLFKREDELTGIIPLCIYTTFGFPITNWKEKPKLLSGHLKSVSINIENISILYNFLENVQKNHFDVFISPSFGNLTELIKTENIHIQVIVDKSSITNEIKSAYFFRKSCVFIEGNKEILTCFASINNFDDDLHFIQAFKISVWNLIQQYKYGYFAIENISHNTIITKDLINKTAPTLKCPTAYFFYNFIHPAISSNKVFILS